MPFNKPRNSREDKSTNPSRKFDKDASSFSRTGSKSGNSDRKKTYGSDERKTERKPFEERAGGEFRKKSDGFKSTENKGGYKSERSEGYKKTGDKSFRPQKTASRFGGESSFQKKDYRDKPAGERSFGQRKATDEGFKSNQDNRRRPAEGGFKSSYENKRRPTDEGFKSHPDNRHRPAEGGFKNHPERSKKSSYEQYRENARKPKAPRPAVQDENDLTFDDQPQRSFKSGSSEGRPYRKEFTPRSPREDRDEKPARVISPADERADRMNSNKNLRSRKNPQLSPDGDLIRLNRYIANAGICSRRKADELIAAGVVSVNGEVISELGYKVNPSKDEVRYNGEALKREKMVYVLLNKPKDYITTTDDPHERRTVMQLVEKASRERIYPVGRLDRNTTGLLLMTNDGDLAEKLSHPRNNITKLYHAELNKSMLQGDLNKIIYGLELEDGFIKPDVVSYVQGGSKREIGIQIHSGKNRIVRRIFEHLGYDVVKLDRVIYGGLTKKDLPRGKWRHLEDKEVNILKNLI